MTRRSAPRPRQVSTCIDIEFLSTKIDAMDDRLLHEAVAARDRLIEAQHGTDSARAEYHHAIRRLHASGGSMREIADALGLSHQRVHQIIDETGATGAAKKTLLRRLTAAARPGGPEPDDRPVTQSFDRMSGDAREAMTLAQDQARSLHHHYIGTEHILLGLLAVPQGIAAQVLSRASISPQQARAAVEQIIGRGKGDPPAGPLRLTPRSKKVLELACKEAKRSRSAHVRSEHLLLGLLREGRGVGAQVLTRLGADHDGLQRRIGMAGCACSFCGRSGIDVASLAAGPGVYICERCTTDASQLASPSGGEPADNLISLVPAGQHDATCSFCGKKRRDVEHLAASQTAAICDQCLALCREIHAEQQGITDDSHPEKPGNADPPG